MPERKVDIVLELMGTHFGILVMAWKLLFAVLAIGGAIFLMWKAYSSITYVSLLQGVALPRVRPVLEFFFALAAAILVLQCGIIAILVLP